MNTEKIGNMEFHDMSDGIDIRESLKHHMINHVLEQLRKGQMHASISTGNFLVVGVAYRAEFQIYITDNYKKADIYINDGDPSIYDAVAF